jgi:hypothetical protein
MIPPNNYCAVFAIFTPFIIYFLVLSCKADLPLRGICTIFLIKEKLGETTNEGLTGIKR